MTYRTLIFALTILTLTACANQNKENADQVLKREYEASIKQADTLGKLIRKISFQVKTDDKDFEDGLIPWVHIDQAYKEISKLIDANEKVIEQNEITIVIEYPLTNPYTFSTVSKDGYTRAGLLKIISENYHKIYVEEEQSAKVKTIPVDKRTELYNRNQTDGKHGIWGHDLADLDLSEVVVYEKEGKIMLYLGIES